MSRFGKPEKTTEHRYFEERLSAYLDGELLPQEQDAVERHVAACQDCQWDLDTLAKTVQWTRELPTVPVPHVFTIQVPEKPQPAARWRWGLVPALQAATALVALLFFFTVAGDVLLGGFRLAGAPEATVMEQEAPAAVEATQVVELAREAPAAEMITSEMVVETVVVEAERAAEGEAEKAVSPGTAGPMPTRGPESASPEEAEPLAAAAEEADIAPDEVMPPAPAVGEPEGAPQAEEPVLSAVPSPTVELEAPVVAGGEPEPTALTTPVPATAQPTALAAAQVEQFEAAEWESGRALRRPVAPWLRPIEYALGVVLLLLAGTTLVFMIQRRRTG
jgi:hypothetical protein